MNIKVKAILISIVIFAIGFSIMQFFMPDRFLSKMFTKTGTLRVESTPTSNVFIDDNLVGQTPLQLNLKEGVHKLKLVPEASSKSLVTYSKSVRIYHNVTTFINRELGVSDLASSGEMLALEKTNGDRGQVLLTSEPPGVFVSLDGEERGVAPLYMEGINPGEHELALRGEGFHPRSAKVNIIAGYKLLAEFKLSVDEDYKKKKEEEEKKKKAAKAKADPEKQIEIGETPTGWLRVRFEPSLGASEAAQVNTGEKFNYLTTDGPWYQIEYEEGKTGWVYGDYVRVVEQ
jgi:hypothetical protein